MNRLDARLLDRARRLLVDQLTRLDQQRAAARLVDLVRILDVLGGDVADDTLGERLDDVLAFLQRADLEALDRAAILLGDRHVLRDVHETTREVAGVGRLERRVGQTLTSAVRRDEVLEHATDPSRKFDLIGLSMISPIPPVSFFCGFAISPRIPAS